MATKKPSVSVDEKLENVEFDLFEALNALDKKDYGYYDRLSETQKKKFSPFMMLQWMSMVKGTGEIQRYYAMSTEYHANKYMFNENIQKHPALCWLMLCASSPGIGKQYRQWIPNISLKVSKLETMAKLKEIKDYYTKVYPSANSSDLTEISGEYVHQQNKKFTLAKLYPNLKLSDIEALNEITTDDQIENYLKDLGN
jgi:hypothetical protein